MSGGQIESAVDAHAGNAPKPRTSAAAADREQHERHDVANADAAADETARVRRLHDDVESVVGVQ
jgi:hypothetical protein